MKEYYAIAIIDNDFDNQIDLGAFESLDEAKKCFLDFLKKNKHKYKELIALYGARERKSPEPFGKIPERNLEGIRH